MKIHDFMMRNIKLIALGLLFSAASCSFTTPSFDNSDKDKLLLDLINYVIERGHYDAKDMNDAFSEAVFDAYLEGLDPYKRYFLEKDIEEFATYKFEIDDMVKEKNLTFFNLTYNRLITRLAEAREIQEEVLSKPFKYSKNETINNDPEKLGYVANKRELKDRWRKQLKLSTLSDFFDKKEKQAEKLKKDNAYKTLSDSELELKARTGSQETMSDFFDRMAELERKDYFSVFLNSVVEQFDPHTYYFPPVAKDRFDTAMSGQFQGIGARLQKKNGEVNITEIISGGPAWLQGDLQAGDIILEVAQENDEESVAISGMRLDEAIKLIKGPKDTKVILTVKSKLDGSLRDIEITRDIVELEETYAKSVLIKKEDKNYGLINLPKFYFDFDDYNKRNAASDIKKEIEALKKQDMQGLVIDLRNNGGGSLRTVVEIAGLFIKDGPIVQVKSNGDEPEILEDKISEITWDGPLVILVNEISASASEILAAAMQDYKRGIVIGGKQTYGKGTVQNVVDLNRWLRQNDYGDMGALKVTTQKFYRVNGGSTQLEGVKSDVVVPDNFTYIDVGERDQKNPLPWDKIPAAEYEPWDGYIDYEKTIESSKARMANNAQIKLIDDYAKWIKERRDDDIWPLNYDQYKTRQDNNKEIGKKFDALDEYTNPLNYGSLPYEAKLFESDSVLQKKRERWHKDLTTDVYVEEAINVLEDLKKNNIKKEKIAVIKN